MGGGSVPPKPGTRALGVAESYRGRDDGDATSTLAGAVVSADRVVDDVTLASCTVGGLDATDAVATLFSRLGRADVRYCLLAGVAPAWFNLLDVGSLAERVDRPVLAVSFEASDGLEAAIRREFSGTSRDRRLDVYRRLPPRRRVELDGDADRAVYVRAVGVDDDDAAALVRAYTATGERPEPLRVARLVARAGRAYRERIADGVDEQEGAL